MAHFRTWWRTSARRGTADTLLDAASYGVRWMLLSRSGPGAPPPAGSGARAAGSSGNPTRIRRMVARHRTNRDGPGRSESEAGAAALAAAAVEMARAAL